MKDELIHDHIDAKSGYDNVKAHAPSMTMYIQ
jgi:hypothetical protein